MRVSLSSNKTYKKKILYLFCSSQIFCPFVGAQEIQWKEDMPLYFNENPLYIRSDYVCEDEVKRKIFYTPKDYSFLHSLGLGTTLNINFFLENCGLNQGEIDARFKYFSLREKDTYSLLEGLSNFLKCTINIWEEDPSNTILKKIISVNNDDFLNEIDVLYDRNYEQFFRFLSQDYEVFKDIEEVFRCNLPYVSICSDDDYHYGIKLSEKLLEKNGDILLLNNQNDLFGYLRIYDSQIECRVFGEYEFNFSFTEGEYSSRLKLLHFKSDEGILCIDSSMFHLIELDDIIFSGKQIKLTEKAKITANRSVSLVNFEKCEDSSFLRSKGKVEIRSREDTGIYVHRGFTFAGSSHEINAIIYESNGMVVVPQGTSKYKCKIGTLFKDYSFYGLTLIDEAADSTLKQGVSINAADSFVSNNSKSRIENDGTISIKMSPSNYNLYAAYEFGKSFLSSETLLSSKKSEELKNEILKLRDNYAPPLPQIPGIMIHREYINNRGDIHSKGSLITLRGERSIDMSRGYIDGLLFAISKKINLSDGKLSLDGVSSIIGENLCVQNTKFCIRNILKIEGKETIRSEGNIFEGKDLNITSQGDIKLHNDKYRLENREILSQTGDVVVSQSEENISQKDFIYGRNINLSNNTIQSKTLVLRAQNYINKSNNIIKSEFLLCDAKSAYVSGNHDITNEVYRIEDTLDFSATTHTDNLDIAAKHTSLGGNISSKKSHIKTNTIEFKTNKISGDMLQLHLQEYESGTVGALLKMDELRQVNAVHLHMPGDFVNNSNLHFSHQNLTGHFNKIENQANIKGTDGASISLHARNTLYHRGEIRGFKNITLQGDQGIRIESTGEVEKKKVSQGNVFSGVNGYEESVRWMQSILAGENVTILSPEGSIEMDGVKIEATKEAHLNAAKDIRMKAVSKETTQETTSHSWFGAVQAKELITQTQNLITSITGALVDIHSKDGEVEGEGAQLCATELDIYGEDGIRLKPVKVRYTRNVTKEGITFNLFGLDLINPENLATYSEIQLGSPCYSVVFKELSLGVKDGVSVSNTTQISETYQHGIIQAQKVQMQTGKDTFTDLQGHDLKIDEMIVDTARMILGGSEVNSSQTRTSTSINRGFDVLLTASMGADHSYQQNTQHSYRPAQIQISYLRNKRKNNEIIVDRGAQGGIEKVEGESTQLHVNYVQETQSQQGYSFGGDISVNIITRKPGGGIRGGFNTGTKVSSTVIDEEGNRKPITDFKTPEGGNRTDVQYPDRDTRIGISGGVSVNAVKKGVSMGSTSLGVQVGDAHYGFKYVSLQPNSSQSKVGQILENINRWFNKADMYKTNLVDNMINIAYSSGLIDEKSKRKYDKHSQMIQNIFLHHGICATGVLTNLVRDIAESKLYKIDENPNGYWDNSGSFLNYLERLDITYWRIISKILKNDCVEKNLLKGQDAQKEYVKNDVIPGSKGVTGEDFEKLLGKAHQVTKITQEMLEQAPIGSEGVFVVKNPSSKRAHVVHAKKQEDKSWHSEQEGTLSFDGQKIGIVTQKNTGPKMDLKGFHVGAYEKKDPIVKIAGSDIEITTKIIDKLKEFSKDKKQQSIDGLKELENEIRTIKNKIKEPVDTRITIKDLKENLKKQKDKVNRIYDDMRALKNSKKIDNYMNLKKAKVWGIKEKENKRFNALAGVLSAKKGDLQATGKWQYHNQTIYHTSNGSGQGTSDSVTFFYTFEGDIKTIIGIGEHDQSSSYKNITWFVQDPNLPSNIDLKKS